MHTKSRNENQSAVLVRDHQQPARGGLPSEHGPSKVSARPHENDPHLYLP